MQLMPVHMFMVCHAMYGACTLHCSAAAWVMVHEAHVPTNVGPTGDLYSGLPKLRNGDKPCSDSHNTLWINRSHDARPRFAGRKDARKIPSVRRSKDCCLLSVGDAALPDF